ncbi:hypothetical protein D3C76_90930 [compost metagenome]
MPAFQQRLCRIAAEAALFHSQEHLEPLRFPVQQLQLPVHSLVVGLAGICPPVIFQVQLPVPGMNILVRAADRFIQAFKIFIRTPRPDFRNPGHLIKTAAHFQHFAVDSPAAIAVSVGEQQLAVEILVPVLIPDSLNGEGFDQPIVGIIPGAGIRSFGRSDKMGQHFAAVNPPPVKRVMRHAVILAPADLRGHKGINARLA